MLVRKGKCNRCGKCCKESYLIKYYGFKTEVEQTKCSHFATIDGVSACLVHDKKPDFCRTFPAAPEDLVSLNCGFYFEEGKA